MAGSPKSLAEKTQLALAGAGYVPLTPEEERTLAHRIRGGDQEATWTLVLANHNFVRSVAQRYVREDVSVEDLVAEGVLGLVEAAQRFDPERSIKFITYGIWWIKRAMLRYLRTFEHAVHVPKYKHYQLHELRRTMARLAQDLGRAATPEELCQASGLSQRDVGELLALAGATESLDADPDGWTPPADERVANVEEVAAQADRCDRLAAVLPLLGERERRVVSERFGLGGGDGTTLADIGSRMGVTKERIRQIEKEACAHLKVAMEDARTPTRRVRLRATSAPLHAA